MVVASMSGENRTSSGVRCAVATGGRRAGRTAAPRARAGARISGLGAMSATPNQRSRSACELPFDDDASHTTKGAHVGIIGWIILGLLAGAIAKALLPGDDPGGIIVTMLIGIAGAIVGGFVASALNIGDLGDFFDIGTWLIAILGSLLLLIGYRAITRGRTAGP